MPGPLAGLKVMEIAGLGPVPFCAMVLADMGADVIRIDRADSVPDSAPSEPPKDVSLRNRRRVAIDLKHPEGITTLLELVEHTDVLIEGFRPGVMERLGIGPETCLDRNPKLVYGRMTGWGQTGPYASAAGHDINYIALSGALAHIGRAGEAPVPPLSLLGDFGGGAMFLAFGVVAALFEARESGQGQVVDTAMVDGVATLMSFFWGMSQTGTWEASERGVNFLDTGAHFYDVYECADGSYISIGSIEPQFYAELLRITGLTDDAQFSRQLDKSQWPDLKRRLGEVFKARTRQEWCSLMEHTDVCFAPVLTMAEAALHPHNIARQMIVEVDGIKQPAPAPRFSRTAPDMPGSAQYAGQGTVEVLTEWGLRLERVHELIRAGAVVAR
ncbi:MAG TPA: CaiB/BaiF CoA-transferase family protein [Ilumatobacter sp.]|nr:CaiB/BaiF CoA-transferase family protein [Ilumatobacter sp.]